MAHERYPRYDYANTVRTGVDTAPATGVRRSRVTDLLAGVRVIESAMLLNGDRLGSLLGDLGADVIKVENPGGGDYLRDILGQVVPHYSPAHLAANRNKRSVSLDLGSDGGREVFWRLIATADVFVDGNAAGTCARLGIDYDAQSSHNPSIVFCHYSGFGATGPYRAIPTHGQMMDALAGAFALETDGDGRVQRTQPVSSLRSTAFGGEGHATGAVYAALHVAAALVARARSGQGCYIDVSAADAVIANAWMGATYSINADRITDTATIPPDELGPKYAFYETSDRRYILFCCIEQRFWERFCRASGHVDLLGRHRTDIPVDYGDGDPEIGRDLAGVIATRTQQEWVELAIQAHVPIGPAVTDPSDLPDDPHLRSRQIFYLAEHPVAGAFTHVGQPAVIPGHPFEVRRHAPSAGEHTVEVLRELGYDTAEIAYLEERGTI